MGALDNVTIGMRVETWDGGRKIGDGTHRRGIVNVVEFEKRYGARQLAMNSD
jgi:fluoroacetyl-CoA thioesterase